MRDCDLQAPWVGKCAEDYYGYDYYEDEEEYDEDFEYESKRDMELMEEEQ